MKKGVIIIIAAVIVIGGGIGVYLTTQNKNENVNNTAQPDSTNQVSASAPEVTYEQFGGDVSGYTFDTIKEWTVVAPEEIQKSITEEQRHGYQIVFYATNPDAIVLSVSEKQVSGQSMTMADIVEDDLASAQQLGTGLTVLSERVNASDARLEMRFTSAQTDYTIYSRYLLLPENASGSGWALIEVSVPSSRSGQYGQIAAHLLDALLLTTASADTNAAAAGGDFADTGEKVNDLLYRENFETIELGTLQKNTAPDSATYGVSAMNYSSEDLSYHIVTTDNASVESQMTLEVYDNAAGQLFGGSQDLTVKRGENKFCCYSPPGQGQYQYLFYLGDDLVKTVDLKSE